MYREITTHKVNGCNDALTVLAVDEPGSGGANHVYHIVQDGTKAVQGGPVAPGFVYAIPFQNGPIKEVGTNGLTHEALTAIVIDRFEAFQRGPFKSDDNEEALNHYRLAMAALKRRTEKRLARGVEGTHAV